MVSPAVTLEVLPAGYGDCLFITCPVGRRNGRMLIDTGPDDTYPALRARLAKLRANSKGHRHIDLFVVTRIDHDHIGGAALLLNDRSLNLSFGDIWFNAPPNPAARGMAGLDIEALATKVTAIDHSVANRSSIAMLLEHRKVSLLLGADAFPSVLVPALQSLALHRRQPVGLNVDAIKLSHHGKPTSPTTCSRRCRPTTPSSVHARGRPSKPRNRSMCQPHARMIA